MGRRNSKHESSDESTDGSCSESSRFQRLRQRLRRHRRNFRRHCRGTNSDSHAGKLLKEGDFAGIALLRIINAEMNFKDKWLACVTLGEQTFRTAISDQRRSFYWKKMGHILREYLYLRLIECQRAILLVFVRSIYMISLLRIPILT